MPGVGDPVPTEEELFGAIEQAAESTGLEPVETPAADAFAEALADVDEAELEQLAADSLEAVVERLAVEERNDEEVVPGWNAPPPPTAEEALLMTRAFTPEEIAQAKAEAPQLNVSPPEASAPILAQQGAALPLPEAPPGTVVHHKNGMEWDNRPDNIEFRLLEAAPVVTAELNEDGNLKNAPDIIWLFSGGSIRPLAPRAEDVKIQDIAHALANQCRFTGHTSRFYSVAEHCVLCMELIKAWSVVPARNVNPRLQLTALLHDASEAYLADIARPVKKAPGFAETYLKFEGVLEEVIAGVFGLEYPFPEAIKLADDAMLAREIKTLLPSTLSDTWPEPDFMAPSPRCWDPERAEIEFNHAYFTLTANDRA